MRFIGSRSPHPTVVIRDDGLDRPLPHICRHSPDGFEWGYGGSGPSDLALSLCVAALGSVEEAEPVYQGVKSAIVANLPHEGFELERTDLIRVIERLFLQTAEG